MVAVSAEVAEETWFPSIRCRRRRLCAYWYDTFVSVYAELPAVDSEAEVAEAVISVVVAVKEKNGV
jgi:hypothetical protein